MTTLRPRTFKAYAVVEALRSGSEDIRGAVIPFFHPLLAFMNGRTLNPAQLAETANDTYAWNLSSDVIEGLIPHFIDQGWVEPLESNEQNSVYRVTCYLPDGAFHSGLTEDLKRLENEFCEYTEEQSPLFFRERTREDLLSLLLQWVVSLDVYDAEQLIRHPRHSCFCFWRY